MSQLGFIDVFDMARESTGGCCATQDVEAGNGYFPSAHRLISAQYSRNRFISVFRSTDYRLRHWEVSSNFLALAVGELDMARIKTPESMAHCQKICDHYTIADVGNMNGMFNLMVCALKAKFHDLLDVTFMELELGDNFRGQYFTPYSVQCLMARLLMPGIQDTIRRGEIVAVSNPASDAAGMLITCTECLLEADINPS